MVVGRSQTQPLIGYGPITNDKTISDSTTND